MAWKRPDPATTKLPESTSSPLGLVDRVALAGEQRLVDLEPVGGAHHAVARDLVAGAHVEQVVEHDRVGRDLDHVAVTHHPSARPRSRTASLSSVRLARTSWKMPMAELATRMSAKVASWIGPITTITASAAPRMALNRVNTLARTISPRVRLVRSPVSLVCPRATRSCTSAEVRPVGAVRQSPPRSTLVE